MRRPNVLAVLSVAITLFGLACGNDDPSSVHDDENQFRPDVFHCVNAAAKLRECCPGFHSTTLECTFQDQTTSGGCDPDPEGYDIHTRVEPALDETESDCIMHMSCASLAGSDVCARAEAAVPYAETTYIPRVSARGTPSGGTPDSSHPPVCP